MANINETYAQRHYESALDFFEQGNYNKALQQIESAISKAPNNPDYYSTKGVFLHRMNDIRNAIEAYENAIRVFPEHTFSHYNLGLIYMKEGKILQAIQQWEEVIKHKPDDLDSIFNIAVALTQLGKTKQSIPFYEKVLSLNPDHVMTHQNLGVIYRDERDFAKAKKHFVILKDLDSTYSEIVDKEIFRCEEQEFLAQMEEAKKAAVSCIESADDSPMSKALSALIAEDFDSALQYSNMVLSTLPDDKSALIAKGQALAGRNKFDQAIEVFEKVVNLHSDDIDAIFQLGNICLSAGRYPEALTYFEKVKSLDENFPLVNENIDSIKLISGSNGD